MPLPIRLARAVLAAIALALILSACGTQPIFVVATVTPAPPTATPRPTLTPSPTPIPYRDTIVVGVKEEPRTLHPFLDDSPAAMHIQDALYERYVTSLDFAYQANPNGGLLAEAPTLENGGATLDDGGTPDDSVDDQLTLIFKMLAGPAWCDGQPVTARDSAYAFNLARDPDSGVASRAALDKIESYVALDEHTIEVKFKPGQLDAAYTAYFWTPLPEHLWSRYTPLELQTAEVAARRPCGYGPYTVAGGEGQGAGWIAGESLTLVANPHYFRGAPRTARLVFRFVPSDVRRNTLALSGRIDILIDDGLASRLPEYAAYENDGKIKSVAVRSPAWEQLVFNLAAPTTFDSARREQPHPILSDARVRQAIAHAIDRRALIERVYGGKSIVLDQPLTYPNHPLSAAESGLALYRFDPDRAAELLDGAGWIDADGDGVRECHACASGAEEGARLTLTYRTTRSLLRLAAAEQIERDLDAAGFDLVVELLPREVFFGDVTGLIVGDFEIGQMAGLSDVDPGGQRQYGCEWIPTPENGWYGENYSAWCNPAASQALFEAGQALHVDARRAAYAVFQREYTRALPGLPLFPRLDVFLISPRLENFKPNDSMPSATWNAYELSVPNQ